MTIKTQKQTYREQARLHRERIEVDGADFEAVINVFLKDFSPAQDKIIALYWPVGTEFDCRFLMDELVKRGYRCVLPVAQKDSRVMDFREWSADAPLQKNIWGVPEPTKGERLSPDIVIAPLLAFDQKGYRLGQGGGHYDSTLEALRAEKQVTYIGIGYAEQAVLFKLPSEAHDIALDYMLTPQSVIKF